VNVDGPREQLAQAYRDLSGMFVSSLPRLATAIVIIVALVAFAKLAEVVLRVVLRRIHVDQMFARAGLDRTLRRLGIERPASVLLPRLVFVLLLFLFAQTAADLLGLLAISSAIQSFFGYLPNIVAAVLLLVMGSIVAQFAGRTVARAAADSGIDFADSLGSVVSGVILFVIGIMAVAQLRIDTEMVRLITSGVLAALAIAFGLSFGLGSRDITRNIIAGFYARKIFHPGDAIEIRGERGVLRAITPIQTIIERDGVVIAVSNATFLDETVRQ
jgi:hypothetical protein